jgi:hypothetical protein
MADTYRHSVSVAGVTVRDDGRILVIKRRDNGQWQAPVGSSRPTSGSRPGFAVKCARRQASMSSPCN